MWPKLTFLYQARSSEYPLLLTVKDKKPSGWHIHAKDRIETDWVTILIQHHYWEVWSYYGQMKLFVLNQLMRFFLIKILLWKKFDAYLTLHLQYWISYIIDHWALHSGLAQQVRTILSVLSFGSSIEERVHLLTVFCRSVLEQFFTMKLGFCLLKWWFCLIKLRSLTLKGKLFRAFVWFPCPIFEKIF